jgi:uncharacterized protein with HEPN domain
MTDEALKYLSDIRHAINLIESFTTDISGFEDYLNDLKTQSAVERQLGIIGEAVNKFEALNTGQVLSHSRKIVGFRNRLIHAYDLMDASMVWVVIKRHLMPLKIEVQAHLNS